MRAFSGQPVSDAERWRGRTVVASRTHPGVHFVVACMTFGRRIELMRRVRDLATRLEYFEAGQDARNGMEASLVGAEIDRLYVLWGVDEIRGLVLDDAPATVQSMIDHGPEDLFQEALAAVKAECGLSETERKN
jgi:hypothetical protein